MIFKIIFDFLFSGKHKNVANICTQRIFVFWLYAEHVMANGFEINIKRRNDSIIFRIFSLIFLVENMLRERERIIVRFI